MKMSARPLKKDEATQVIKLRETDGWRKGKPIEDPEKLKRWGFITVKPSEYLVHVRKGKVLTRTSGQGATCFKWPSDAVAVVPTSIQQLMFRADQVTAEKVGVEVVGLAVYRIAEPLLAYRVLNFSYPERAQEKLEETLTSMFVGATRRLVANLSVDDCLQKRKSALAEELLREIAPVVGGIGRPDDVSEQGWGVVLDTIEIQEVRVLSEKVFASMQAPYRTALDRRAREAKALADTEVAQKEAEWAQQTAEVKIKSEAAVREQREEANRRAAEADAKDKLRLLELAARRKEAELAAEAELRARKAALEVREAEEQSAAAIKKAELEAEEAEEQTRFAIKRTELATLESAALLAAFESEKLGKEKRAELARAEAALEDELRRGRVETSRIEGRAQAEIALAMAEAEARKAEAEARMEVARNLPALAQAIGSRIGEVKIAQYGGGGENPFAMMLGGLQAVMDTFGVLVKPKT
jgi:flotillin